MDYQTSKEVAKLKAEENMSQEALDAEKFLFAKKLNGEMGKAMMEALNNPKKPSLLVGIKNRMRRRKTIRDNKKNKKGDI